MTLRIEDGKREYKFVTQMSRKKKELVIIDAVQQVLLSLWHEGKHPSDCEDRALAHLILTLGKLRKDYRAYRARSIDRSRNAV